MNTSDDSFDLSDRRVLVTGASRGIGAAIAERFGQFGASVAVNYHSSDQRAGEVADAIRETGGEATTIQADVSQSTQAADLVERTVEAFDGLDTVVNSAGVCRPARVQKLHDEAIDEVVDTNLKGALYISREAAPHLESAPAADLVFVSSIAAQSGTVDAGYAASKAGLLGLMRELARELGPDAIQVNAVSPGPVATDMGDGILEYLETIEFRGHENLDTFLDAYNAEPTDVAEAVTYLVGTEFVTGENLTVNGGMYLD